jgi:integrase
VSGVIAYALLVALRTGMRSSEMTAMSWGNVHATWVHLPDSKNGKSRDVPLDKKTRRYFETLRGGDAPFEVGASTRDARFRYVRDRLGLEGFTFHDSRHTAATRMGAKVGQPGRLSFPEFCAVFGWKNPAQALVYVNPSAASLAGKL